MNKKSCFIIPTWPPHFGYLNFLNNLPDNLEFDICFVLSYNSDEQLLNSMNYKKIYKTIVIEHYLSSNYIDEILRKKIEDQGIITLKKFIALDILKKEYKYLCTVDSEIEFVNTNKVDVKLENYCNKKIIIGSTVNEVRTVTNPFYVVPQTELVKVIEKINKESSNLFSNDEKEILFNMISNRFYFWFSDIPVYQSELLIDFFNHIQFSESTYVDFSKKLNYYSFDYIIYVYFCLLYKNYKILDIKNHNINRNWSLESIPYDVYLDVLKIGYEPMCLIYNTYKENEYKNLDIVLTYHKNDGKYVYL
jgi:hypothetical protein